MVSYGVICRMVPYGAAWHCLSFSAVSMQLVCCIPAVYMHSSSIHAFQQYTCCDTLRRIFRNRPLQHFAVNPLQYLTTDNTDNSCCRYVADMLQICCRSCLYIASQKMPHYAISMAKGMQICTIYVYSVTARSSILNSISIVSSTPLNGTGSLYCMTIKFCTGFARVLHEFLHVGLYELLYEFCTSFWKI